MSDSAISTPLPTPTEISGTSINEIVRRFPSTAAAFNHHGIDSCCGGGATVADGAARDGADAATLVSDLVKLISEAA